MRTPGRRHFRTALVAALVCVVAVPALPGAFASASPAAGSRVGAGSLLPAVNALPASLQTPWAARSGFDAARAASVASVHPATGEVAVTVTLWPRSPAFFTIPLGGARPLTGGEIGDAYGLTASDYANLSAYFVHHGLTITHTWPNRLSMSVAGTSAAVAAAFGTTLSNGTWQGHWVRFPDSVATLPAPYASEIAAISGLDSGFSRFTIPFSPDTLPATAPDQMGGRTSKFIFPSAAHLIYDLNGLYNYSGTPHWATGQSIAIVLWGEGYSPSDIQDFYGSYYPGGFPSIQVAGYPVDGASPPSANSVFDPSGAAQELTLDLEWSGSEAPGATLYAVYAPDGPASNNYSPSDAAMEDALNSAINLSGVHVVSMSFGTPDGSDPAFQAAFSISFQDAVRRGITVLAASGDNGGDAKAGCSGGTSPQFPASSPNVLAVGGTAPVLTLDTVGGVTGLDSEPAWNLSGGGYSTTYAPPSWQKVGSAKPLVEQHGFRGIPDVAGPAAYNFFYFRGATAAGKGTSFATPMWAGIVAEMDAIRGTPFGLITPRLYAMGASEAVGQAAQGLVDVTAGANCLGSATTGWDTATGWGSPRGLLLYQDLTFSFVDMSLGTSSGSVVPGGSVTATVQVVNSTSHRVITGLPIDFSLDAIGSVGFCTGTLSSGNATTDGAGNATLSLSVPGCYFGSHITITATLQAQGYFGSNSTTLTVNLLGIAGFLAVSQTFPYNVITFAVIMASAVLVGLAIGNWRHRRARRRANGRGRNGGVPPGAAAPPPPPPPSVPPPDPVVPPAEPPDAGPGAVPSHVVEPPT